MDSNSTRLSLAVLGAILLAQGVGKAADMAGYLQALAAFGTFPDAVIGLVGRAWMFAELLSGAGLLAAAIGRPALGRPAAMGAVAVNVGYLVVTGGAWIRGASIKNCTCFGVFLAQELSLSTLFQDLVMLAWAAWALRTLRPQPADAAPAAPDERPTPT